MPFIPPPKNTDDTHSDEPHTRSLFAPRKLPTDVLAIFCTKIAFIFDSGLTIRRGLPLIFDASGNRAFLAAMRRVQASVLAGSSFSDSLVQAGVFPDFLCGYIRIGEQAGNLGTVCNRLAKFYEEKHESERDIRTSLYYPIFVSITMLAVFVLAFVFVLPGFEDIFYATGATMPPMTLAMIDFSRFAAANAVTIVACALALLLLVLLALKSNVGANLLAAFLLKFSLVRKNVNYSLAQALWLLLDGGLTISHAMPKAIHVIGNRAVRRDLALLSEKLERGEVFWRCLGEFAYIEPIFIELARLGEETSTLPHVMEKFCRFSHDTFKRSLKQVGKFIQPAVTFVLGALLLLMVLSVVLPTFEMATIM